MRSTCVGTRRSAAAQALPTTNCNLKTSPDGTRPGFARRTVSDVEEESMKNLQKSMACLLALLIFLQPFAALGRTVRSPKSTTYTNEASHTKAFPNRKAHEATVAIQSSSSGVELTALSTAFNNHTGIDYHGGPERSSFRPIRQPDSPTTSSSFKPTAPTQTSQMLAA